MLPDNAARQSRPDRQANQLDRRRVTADTRRELAASIAEVDDPDARNALALMFEILTGEEPDGS